MKTCYRQLAKMSIGSVRSPRRSVHLVLDWDSTLTTQDTMSLLGRLPEQRDIRIRQEGQRMTDKATVVSQQTQKLPGKQTSLNREPPDFTSTSSIPPDWDYFFKAYIEDYGPHKARHFPTTNDHKAFCNYLNSLKAIEMRSVQRVQNSGFFRGVKACDVAEVAQTAVSSGEVEMREGWAGLLEMFTGKEDGRQVSILSVNWSKTFIRSCLQAAATKDESIDETRKQALVDLISEIPIIANDLDGLTSAHGSTGQIIGGIQTSADKLSRLPRSTRTKKDLAIGLVDKEEGGPYICYIGDSATDYECIAAADFGLYLVDDLEDAVAKLSKILGPLNHNPTELANGIWNCEEGTWWKWASSLDSMVEFLDAFEVRVRPSSQPKA